MLERNGIRKTRLLLGAALIVLLMAAGCGKAAAFDRDAETIMLTDLSQADAETLASCENLKTLDLRSVDATAALVDELTDALPGCEILWRVPIGGETFDSVSAELSLPAGTAAAELSLLRFFPNLTRVDATRCDVDAEFAACAAAYPDVIFTWNTTIGTVAAKGGDTELDLSGQDVGSAETLAALLFGLPSLEEVNLTGTGLSAAEIEALQARYPSVAFVCDVDVLGLSVPNTSETLDLTQAQIPDIASLESALRLLPELKSVDLSGHAFSFEDMDALQAAFPDLSFNFSFEVFSQQVTTETTRLDLRGNSFSTPEEVAKKLIYLPNLTYADLCDCGLTNEEMETLMQQFPDVKFVWTITVGAWEMRTDITAFSKGNRHEFPNDMGRFVGEGSTNLHDADIEPLKYCTDLVYLDLGHGNRITDVSALAGLQKLRVLIVSMNKIEDITPLAQLQALECLEIYQNPITDISVVTSLPNLKYLNCSSILLDDITPLLGLTQLKMLWFVHNKNVTEAQREQLENTLPECEICFSAESSGEGGWTKNDLYIEYQTAFGLSYNQ